MFISVLSFTKPLYLVKTLIKDCYIKCYLSYLSLFSESIAYEFGPGRGIITYTFPPSAVADTETDKVAVGFVTSKSDAVLLRIESSNTQDYMQMEIVSRETPTKAFIQHSKNLFNEISNCCISSVTLQYRVTNAC